MKHRLLLALTGVLLLITLTALVACGDGDTTTAGTTSTDAPDTTTTLPATTAPVTEAGPTKEEIRAMEMVETIFKHYAVEGESGDKAYINFTEYHNTNQSGYLWTNFSAVGMQYYVCKLYPEDAEQKEIFRKMINNFRYFRQYSPGANAAPDSVKYHSGRGSRYYTGTGTCFFDDNIWVARNYLRAYEILGDKWYLEEAIRVNNWVLSGWNHELGGIVWSEAGLRDDADAQNLERGLSANACAIIVNAQLASLAKNDEDRAFHLNWAEKFYTFCKQMQNTPISHDYWNGIHTVIVNGVRQNGEVNKVHFSYNSGSMILANLALYEITADETKKAAYLEDAIETAKSAKKTFYKVDAQLGKRYYTGDPWFAAILNEAYFELFSYDKELAESLIAGFNNNVGYAYGNRDTATGLFPYQATKKNTFAQNESWCIHQIGVAQQAVLVALYEKTAQN
ncbi:MAG: hypothetical protein IJW46_07730 [Clostridia bacterium]|nr:hypothetical protein [Clostridia bacterium]